MGGRNKRRATIDGLNKTCIVIYKGEVISIKVGKYSESTTNDIRITKNEIK